MAYREPYSVDDILNSTFFTICYETLKVNFKDVSKYYCEQCACSYGLKFFNSKMEPASQKELCKYAIEYFKLKNIDC